MELSFIIPVYNTEKYVEQCLQSCINQDLPKNDYEIIVINDGSKDHSLEIVESVAKEYSNIIIISQENAGQSAARNTGLAHAKGEFVWFVDSDDWIEKNCLKKIVEKMEKDALDGLVYAGIRYVDGVTTMGEEVKCPNKVFKGREYMSCHTINCAAVKTIYRKEFLDQYHLRFYEGIYHEDHEFTPRAYYFINRIEFVNDHVYYNRQTPGSITQAPNPKKAFDLLIVAENLYEFMKEHDMEGVETAFNDLITSAVNQSLSNSIYMDTATRQLLNKEIHCKKHLLKSYIHSSSQKNKLAGVLFNVFSSKVTNIYLLMNKFNP